MLFLLKTIGILLWPPHYFRFVKSLFGPRSPGWGGAIESIMMPFSIMLALFVLSLWIAAIAGLGLLAQHVSFH